MESYGKQVMGSQQKEFEFFKAYNISAKFTGCGGSNPLSLLSTRLFISGSQEIETERESSSFQYFQN